uniref:Secreted protein n=1 Tax=Triticum urartu TaxID=4572 RepID=A0A8R7R2P1_TRIUA
MHLIQSMSWSLFEVCLAMFFLHVFNPSVASGCCAVTKVHSRKKLFCKESLSTKRIGKIVSVSDQLFCSAGVPFK